MRYETALKQATQGERRMPHAFDDTTSCDCLFIFGEHQNHMGSICTISKGDGFDGPKEPEAKANAALICHEHEHFGKLLKAAQRIGQIYHMLTAKFPEDLQAVTDLLNNLAKAAKEAEEVKGL